MASQNIYILGIESSCDDTAAAVIHNGHILSNVIANQKIHEEYGGVVPELASRAHQQNIVPVVTQALKKANITKDQLHAVAQRHARPVVGARRAVHGTGRRRRHAQSDSQQRCR